MTSNTLPDAVLELHDVTKTYGTTNPVHALAGVTLQLQRGQFTAIMGPSGSGKSTLMNIAAGLDRASTGSVRLGGIEIGGMNDDQLTLLRRERIGFVFQSFNLLPTLTAWENVLLPFDLAGLKVDGTLRARVETLFHTLGIWERRDHKPSALSGGQQQRVAIARALASRPDMIFADEPTGNLDTKSSREVLSLLRAAGNEHGQSIAMVTHDPVAASNADRVVIIADGRVVGDYPRLAPEQISKLMIDLEVTA